MKPLQTPATYLCAGGSGADQALMTGAASPAPPLSAIARYSCSEPSTWSEKVSTGGDCDVPVYPLASNEKGMQDVDLSKGVQSAVPGWDNVRLLAPHAELKLQACGQSPLIDAHRLRCVGLSQFEGSNVHSSVWRLGSCIAAALGARDPHETESYFPIPDHCIQPDLRPPRALQPKGCTQAAH